MQLFSLYCNSLSYEHRSEQKVQVLLQAATKCYCITELIIQYTWSKAAYFEPLSVIGFGQI